MAFQGDEDHFRGVTVKSANFTKHQIENFADELTKVTLNYEIVSGIFPVTHRIVKSVVNIRVLIYKFYEA